MIKNGVPYCDYCNKELVALREEEALGDIEPHGWTDWRTASVHACFECYDNMWEPPCGECENHPCQKGRECWANPPLHLFPYETYFANKLKLPFLGEDCNCFLWVFNQGPAAIGKKKCRTPSGGRR